MQGCWGSADAFSCSVCQFHVWFFGPSLYLDVLFSRADLGGGVFVNAVCRTSEGADATFGHGRACDLTAGDPGMAVFALGA